MKIFTKIIAILLPPLLWGAWVFLAAFDGAWLQPVAHNQPEFQTYVSNTLKNQLKGNGAVLLLKNGKIDFQYFQTAQAHQTDGSEINGDTVFPVASMSKFFAALAVHKLATQGAFSLSDPVHQHLKSWQLPASEFNNDKVTIAMLLSHTGGLTDGLGFGDYRADEALPDVVASLNNPRASNGKKVIQVGMPPGDTFAYSGGGYLILELLVEDITGQPFEQWVSANILLPAGMNNSGYGYLAEQDNNSGSYDNHGQPVEVFKYASSAATALNASVYDLAAMVKQLQSNEQLTSALQQPMGFVFGESIWGPGAMHYVPVGEGGYVYGHDGSNDPAINSSLRINPVTGDAFIALVTGHSVLASELGYEWTLWQTGKPDFIMTDRAIASAQMPFIIGLGIWIALIVVYFVRRRFGKN
ncbi:serine hydrolase domain-containing protein [Planctobacterium marinum]|uniref:serine hydrolase domain-containing protein n=1 Tax=Planctobacterium marinum TaxID=1631968 RepID=UPI001E36044E|nr:serine hydrolase domain-containing protein [Planctobacterium marinum]MCC2607862.1 beta-lactamase family protein [Planctobacterium marinum]